jgi:hypothetical protein
MKLGHPFPRTWFGPKWPVKEFLRIIDSIAAGSAQGQPRRRPKRQWRIRPLSLANALGDR